MYAIVYKGVSSLEMGIFPKDRRIQIPPAERDVTVIEVPGRDGALHIDNQRYKTISIPVNFNYKTNEDDVMFVFRKVKKWLSGSGKFKITYDSEYFYKCSNVIINNFKISGRICEFTAIFDCEPFAYSEAGQYEITNPVYIYNDGYIAKPTYRIVGEGMCTLGVNGNAITVNVGQEVIINTSLMIAHRNGINVNTTVTGNIEDMILKEGDNHINITQGFTLYTTPEWRYL